MFTDPETEAIQLQRDKVERKIDRLVEHRNLLDAQYLARAARLDAERAQRELAVKTEHLSDARAQEQQLWVSIREIIKQSADSEIRTKLRELYDSNNDGT